MLAPTPETCARASVQHSCLLARGNVSKLSATHPSCLDGSVERFHEVQKLSLYPPGFAGSRLSNTHGSQRRRRSDCRRPEPAGRPEHAPVGAEAAGRHRGHPRPAASPPPPPPCAPPPPP